MIRSLRLMKTLNHYPMNGKQSAGLYKVYAQAIDDHDMVTTSTVKLIEVRNGFLYDGEMAVMVLSEEPDLIFSNKTYKKLVYIDPIIKKHYKGYRFTGF